MLLVADVADGTVDVVRTTARVHPSWAKASMLAGGCPLSIARTQLPRRLRASSKARRRADARVRPECTQDAENGEAFLGEIEWSYGFETRLLSGHDEALLTFRGVTVGRAIEEDTLIVDVGGSTELLLGGRRVSFHTSLDLGCVRLTERFGDDIEACAARPLRAPRPRTRRTIGAAGTVTALAALDLGLLEYEAARVRPPLERRRGHATPSTAGGAPTRRTTACAGSRARARPVIVAGAVIVREVLARYDLTELETSDHDILHGAVLVAARASAAGRSAAAAGAYTCC